VTKTESTGIRLFESAATFRKFTAAKVAFVFLGIVDLVLTVLAVNLGLTEINPFMRLLIQIPVLLLAVKVFIPVFIAWIMPGKLLIPSIALLVMVVGWNIKEFAVYLF
jgi:hypothetical protein